MRVRATKFGFYLHQRQPGVEFEFEGKPSGNWMEPVDAAAREAFKKAGIKVAPKPAAPPSPPSNEEGKKGEGGGKGKDPEAPPGTGGSSGDQNVI